MTRLELKAPLAGWALPLDGVDDPVFSERMMGDGMAIDPLDGIVRSPAAAEVIAIAPTGHSVTLRLQNGAELLIHVGLDTVKLGGRGFEVRTQLGARVDVGDELIAFDLELVSREAKSLVTPIVVLTDGFAVELLASGAAVRAGDPLLQLAGTGAPARSASVTEATARAETVVPLAHGIHARPAARISAALKPMQADVRLLASGRECNARSTVALLTLGVKQGDTVEIRASGPDADAAVRMLTDLIDSGMGESEGPGPTATQTSVAVSSGPQFAGVCAAPGLAVGPIAHLRIADLPVPEDGQGTATERTRLSQAMGLLRSELDADVAGDSHGVASAHRSILDDPEIAAAATRQIDAGRSAPFAWRAATRELADQIRRTGNGFLIERIDDLVDVERRLIAKMLGGASFNAEALPDKAILLSETLLPSEFMALRPGSIGGIVTARGGPTSHVAIMAASAGVPMLVAAGDGIFSVAEGTVAVLDATAGILDSTPALELLAATERKVRAASDLQSRQQQEAMSDCVMADGTRIEVFANLGSVADAERAVGLGAEGCGLLRTEFLFLDRATPPDEAEQRSIYSQVAQALHGRPLIVRTLDIGGDKPVPYLGVIHEENPALGRRGVRLSLARPDVLAVQLRAILSAMPADQCRIMVPMIVDVAELRAVRALLEQASRDVGVTDHIPLGVMIETPSAAVVADTIAAEADFLSVGTNDLSQYVLAVDRGNPAVAGMVDALHPAVLRLIGQAAEGASRHGRWLGVCGGLASEPKAAAILIGLGVTELSAVPAAIPALKSVVRNLSMDHCRDVAGQALALATASEVRALLAGDE